MANCTACTCTTLEISTCSACRVCVCQPADKLCNWLLRCLPISHAREDNHKLIYPLADAGMLLGLGFLPTIRISHSDSTREAKWDNRVFVEACNVHSKVTE